MNKTHRTRVANVLVVGSGAAGLRAAIAVHAAGREVVIVGKRLRKNAHTVLAAGGIKAALLYSRPPSPARTVHGALRR
jgi:succinate dehydrogenase / fumarate reductase flavoprotein subunit